MWIRSSLKIKERKLMKYNNDKTLNKQKEFLE